MRNFKIMSGDLNTVTSISIENQLSRLSMEAEVLSNVINTFKNIVPNLAHKLKDVLGTIDTNNDDKFVKEIDGLNQQIKPKLKNVNYVLYKKTLVSVPEGFHGNFLEYVMKLLTILPNFYTMSNELLGEYNFVLSSFITNKENKTALKDHTALYKKAANIRTSVNDEVSGFFKSHDSSKKYLENVISKFGDLDILSIEIKKLTKIHNNQNLEQFKESVKKSSDLLNIIIKNVQDEDSSMVSGASAKNISEGAFEVAKLVETVSIVNFRTQQIIQSVVKLFETVDKIAS